MVSVEKKEQDVERAAQVVPEQSPRVRPKTLGQGVEQARLPRHDPLEPSEEVEVLVFLVPRHKGDVSKRIHACQGRRRNNNGHGQQKAREANRPRETVFSRDVAMHTHGRHFSASFSSASEGIPRGQVHADREGSRRPAGTTARAGGSSRLVEGRELVEGTRGTTARAGGFTWARAVGAPIADKPAPVIG